MLRKKTFEPGDQLTGQFRIILVPCGRAGPTLRGTLWFSQKNADRLRAGGERAELTLYALSLIESFEPGIQKRFTPTLTLLLSSQISNKNYEFVRFQPG